MGKSRSLTAATLTRLPGFQAQPRGLSAAHPQRTEDSPTFPHRRAQAARPRSASAQPQRPCTHSARPRPSLTGGVACGRGVPPILPTPADLLVFTVNRSGGRFEWAMLCGPHYSSVQGWALSSCSQPPGRMLWDGCVPPNLYIEVLTPGPQNMTVFGDGVRTKEFSENEVPWAGPNLICLVSL